MRDSGDPRDTIAPMNRTRGSTASMSTPGPGGTYVIAERENASIINAMLMPQSKIRLPS